MTNDDQRLAAWLHDGPDHGPAAGFEAIAANLPATRQRPAWLVSLTGGTIATRGDVGLRLSAALVTGLLALLVGGLILSGGPAPVPDPSATAEPTATDGALVPSPAAAEVIFFTEVRDLVGGEEDCTGRHCRRSWVAIANLDGTGQRRLFPDAPPTQSVVAASPDGRQVIVTGLDASDGSGSQVTYYLTDLSGSTPMVLDTSCTGQCVADWIGPYAFSPDGARLAFVRSLAEVEPRTPEGDATVIAVMDLASGAVVELGSTHASNRNVGMPCGYACGEGDNDAPRWSPDGRRLLFSRSGIGIPNQPRTILDTKLFVVDADGSNLRQLVATDLFARDAQWSPDGSLIVFTSAVETLTIDDFGRLENWHQLNDIYTVHPDGSDLRRLTTFTAGPVPDPPGDLGARFPTWTRDGHIVFNRRVADPARPDDSASNWEFWVMAADGTDASSLGTPNAATLSGLGCVECAYPVPDWGDPIVFGFWRPSP